jgi:hypothetical protein
MVCEKLQVCKQGDQKTRRASIVAFCISPGRQVYYCSYTGCTDSGLKSRKFGTPYSKRYIYDVILKPPIKTTPNKDAWSSGYDTHIRLPG